MSEVETRPQPIVENRPGDTYLWHSKAQMSVVRRSERVIVRGEGAYVWDQHGNKLLDAPASLWYCNVGHGRREIAEAVASQMQRLEAYSTFTDYATAPALELAARVAGMVPIEDPRVFLTSGGSDAVDTAVKLARRYWQLQGKTDKTAVVTREAAYHGLHGFGTSMAGIEFNRVGFGELMPNMLRVPVNDADALRELAAERGDEIAAFVFEPVIGTGGVLPPAEGYLRSAQAICREHDILFVADEVICGFGRTGTMFACERFGLNPDIVLMAKGITSGYLPLGAAAFGQRLWEPFWQDGSEVVFHHGLTYAGHASCCAAALANLDILEREDLVRRVARLERELAAALSGLADHPAVEEVRGPIGLMAGVQLADPGLADAVCEACAQRGVLIRPITGGALQISPPFVIGQDEIDLLVEALAASLDAVVPRGPIAQRFTDSTLDETISSG